MPTQLSARFEGDPSAHGASWDQLWKEGCTPWDRKTPSPALVDLIEKERVPFATQAVSSSAKSKTALIPGCGRGYDVDYLARALAHRGFAQVIGLDVSKEAVQAAKQYLKDNSSPPGASAEVGDFFKPQDSATWTTGVDLIYDYTFLCALHPSMRTSWGARMAELVVPGGFLITLQFPLDSHTGGPPFSLSKEIYDELLLDNFTKIFIEQPIKNFSSVAPDSHLIAVYQRKD